LPANKARLGQNSGVGLQSCLILQLDKFSHDAAM
jgi:hypothetical protein